MKESPDVRNTKEAVKSQCSSTYRDTIPAPLCPSAHARLLASAMEGRGAEHSQFATPLLHMTKTFSANPCLDLSVVPHRPLLGVLAFLLSGATFFFLISVGFHFEKKNGSQVKIKTKENTGMRRPRHTERKHTNPL